MRLSVNEISNILRCLSYLTFNIERFLRNPVCHCNINNKVIGGKQTNQVQMLQFQQHLFPMFFFLHKWRHIACVMTSSIILSLSVLNIWRCGGSQSCTNQTTLQENTCSVVAKLTFPMSSGSSSQEKLRIQTAFTQVLETSLSKNTTWYISWNQIIHNY